MDEPLPGWQRTCCSPGVSHDHPPFSDYHSLVTIAARPSNVGKPVRRSSLVALHSRPDTGERLSGGIFALGGVVITLSLAGALWATNHPPAEHRALQLISEPVNPEVEPGETTASAGRARRGDSPYNGTVVGIPATRASQVATAPLGWNDLTLMLRTGLTDDEIIAAAAGKQLTTAVGPEQVRMLREIGAGNRLISYLQGQIVYDAPASAPARTASARPLPQAQTSYAPAGTTYPTVDYAARDRQVASLKKRIDALDEQIRVARTRPNGYAYAGKRYYYRADDTSLQQAADSYIKSLEDQRDDLRRQKWQLEGR